MANPEQKKSAVIVPEEFQKQVIELLDGRCEQEIDFVQDICQTKMQECWDKKNKGKMTPATEFTDEDMPE